LGSPSPPIVFVINSKAAWGVFWGTRCRPAARTGMPQDGKDDSEMVGIQAGHETAHIFERLAKCEGLDQCQNVPLS
jgi:hypothetical protein